jgi:choline dehydrogenase-like flavoprotein
MAPPRDVEGMTALRTEIAIIGAGAAGCFMAHRLAAAGRDVHVFDAGPPWTLGDLVSSQIWARRIKWGGAPVESGGGVPFGHNMNMGWGFGGAALHHYGAWPRLHPTDFRTRSLYGRGEDWPFPYEELRPHYDRIQDEFGMSGDAEKERHRGEGAPYPHPPLRAFAGGQTLARGFDASGLQTYPAPMAILSEQRGSRAACVYDVWCDAGCPIGSLANPLVTSKPLAEDAGAVFHAWCDVRHIETDKDGRARRLVYRDKSGEARKVEAETLILAAGAVHNVRLLFASEGKSGALGNAHDRLGRGISAHLMSNVHGLFKEETEPHLGLSAGTLMAQHRAEEGPEAGTGAITWGLGPALKPNDIIGIASTRPDLFGEALDRFLKHAAKHIAVANAITESLAHEESRLVPSGRKDAFGRDIIRIAYRPSDFTESLWRRAPAQGMRAVKAAGAEEVWASEQPITSHALGGTVMGDDPKRAVTDDLGRLHEAKNVVVTGSGLFPTGGCVSPTFTLLALADRTAERMISSPEEFA